MLHSHTYQTNTVMAKAPNKPQNLWARNSVADFVWKWKWKLQNRESFAGAAKRNLTASSSSHLVNYVAQLLEIKLFPLW